MNELELTKATGMLWEAEVDEHGTIVFYTVDKVHGLYFSVRFADEYYARMAVADALEKDIFGPTAIPKHSLGARDRSYTLDIDPAATFSTRDLRQFIAKARREAKISPEQIQNAVKARTAFHRMFLPVTEIMPVFKFCRISESYQQIPTPLNINPTVPLYFQEYRIGRSRVRMNGMGKMDMWIDIETERESLFQAFASKLLEFPFGETNLIRVPGKRLSIRFSFTIDDQLGNLVEFAESPLGKLYQQYAFDTVEK